MTRSTLALAAAAAVSAAIAPFAFSQCPTGWTAGPGIPAAVRAFAIYDNDLIAGGEFTTADGQSAGRIARWDGAAWHSLGQFGVNSRVDTLAVIGGDLYAGGAFTTADGQPAGHVARLAGSLWVPVGNDVLPNGPTTVRALCSYGGDLCAGGYFSNQGGIVRLVAGTWQTIASGFNDAVRTLTVFEGSLIAGGEFTTSVGVPMRFVARWNGSGAWQAMGSGPNGAVSALQVINDRLFAGGEFPGRIARWNALGDTWETVGAGLPHTVNAIALYNGSIYAGGQYLSPASPATRLSRWTVDTGGGAGGPWSTLGPGSTGGGPNNTVFALLPFRGELVVGGSFSMANTTASPNWARWRTLCPADANCDGLVTPADVAAFVNTWITSLQASSLEGDFDGNGTVAPADVAAFVSAWFAAVAAGGC